MPDTNVLQPISSPLVGQEKLSGWGYLQDIALAPIRGAEGLVKSVYELADWATGDRLLKDYKQGGFLGESQTLAGGLIEGISQFAIGWGTTGLATKLIAKGIPMLASAQAGLGATAKALSAGDKVTKGARLAQFGANAGKGAVVDFWAFEGDEGRLSDLIQKYPALQNPITEFLSSDGDDGELEGRLKNTVEGLGLGAAVDLLVASSKALRNTTKNGGVTPEDLAQVDKQMKLMDATKQAEEVKVSLKTSKKGEGVQLKSDPRLFAYKSHGEAAQSYLDKAKKAPSDGDRSYVVNGERAKSSGLHAEEVDKVLSTSLVGRIANGDTKFKVEVDDTVAHYVEAALLPLRKYAENGMKGPKGGAPVRFDDVLEKVSESIKRMNETTLTSDDLGYLREVMAENVDKYIDKLVGDDPKIASTTLEKFMESAKDELIDYSIRTGGLGELSYEKALAGLREGNDQVARGMIKQQAMRPMVSQAVLELHALAERTIAAVDSGTNPDFIEEFLSSAEVLKDLQLAYDETKYLAGLNLRIQGSDAGDVALYTTRGIQRENVRGLKRIKARTQDPLRAKELAEDILKFVDPDNLETVDKFAAGIRETNVGRKWDGYKAWIKNNLLWSPATHVMNFTNNNLKILMRSGEQYFGAKMTGFFYKKNPQVVQEMKWQAEGATVELRKFLTNIQDGLHIMKTTWKAGGQGKLLDTNAVKALDGVSHDPLAAGAYVKATSPADMKAYLHNFKVGLGELVMPVHSMPGRALSSIDEGMKTMNYDASFQSLSYIEGRRRGLSKLEAEKFSSRMFQESKMAGGRMTSDKGYNEYAREVAEQRINERFGDAVVSPVARRDAIATEQKAIYEAINPNDKIQKKARTILRQEESNQVPAGTYESFINSPEYRDVDQLFKIGQEAQRRALDNTFQTPTKAGTRRGALPAFLKRAAGADNVGGAALSTALPFISTPWNVVSYAVDTLVAPFGVALKATKGKQGDFLRKIEAGINSNDPQQLGVAVEYAGRIVMGTTLATSGLLLARSGLITGKRPDNKAEAQLWDDLGIQEYSFRAGDKYISFTRLEPIGTILGIMGDMASTHAMTPNEDKAFFATLATALASNITDKTFLTSLSGVLEAATSGEEHRLNRAVSSLVSPMFANPGVASLNRNLFDEGTVRELRTLTDAIMSKTPGEAQRVDPRRNLFGEVVTRGTPSTTGIVGDAFSMLNPFYTSARKDDRVLNEILTFGDVPTTPSPFIGKLDLRDIPSTSRLASANDERNELVGTVKVGGKTLREALSDLMDSPRYKRLEPTGSTEEFSDPRFLMFQRVIRRYRSRALIELRKNNPEINRLILESDSLQRQINVGRASTVTAQNLLRRT